MFRFSLDLRLSLGIAGTVLAACAASAQSPPATNTVIAFGYGVGQLVTGVTPIGGYTGTIDLSYGTLPAHISCTLAPAMLTINGAGPFTDTLTVSTNAQVTAQLHNPGPDRGSDSLFRAGVFFLPGSMAAVFGLRRRKHKHVTPGPVFWIIAFVLLIGSALSSCGGAPPFAKTGTYTIPISRTVSGEATQNISATVVVE